jgi:cephalosporin hydroxylase
MIRSLGKITPRILAKYFRNSVIDAAHTLLYTSVDLHQKTAYLGYSIDQLPTDMWLYQELVFLERPAFILQTGVDKGGSLLYFATLLDLVGAASNAIVIGIDICLSESAKSLTHPRIRLIEGSSTDKLVIAKVEALIPGAHGLVVLDSDHSLNHVRRELAVYHRFTSINRHLVVEDTNINGHPVFTSFGPGPMEAVDEFLSQNRTFVRDDPFWRRYLFSFHQFGWLLRVQ